MRLSKLKKLILTVMMASLVFAFGATLFTRVAPTTARADEQPAIADLVQITGGQEAIFVNANASGAGMKIGQVSANGAGVTFSLARPKTGAIKIGLWNTDEANIWTNGFILQVNGKAEDGSVSLILKDGSENVLIGEQSFTGLGETLSFVAYTVEGENGSLALQIVLNGETVVNMSVSVTLGTYINVYNECRNAFAFLSNYVTFEDVPALSGQEVFTLRDHEVAAGQRIGQTSKEGAGIAFRIDRPTSGQIKFGLWSTRDANVWSNGVILQLKAYAEQGKVGLILKDGGEAILVDEQVITNAGEELSFECFPLATEQGTNIMIRLNGNVVVNVATNGIQLGRYFNAYTELGIPFEIRSIHSSKLNDVFDITGKAAVAAPANGSSIGEVTSITHGFTFKMARPTSGTIKIGLWNTDGGSVWSNGYILQIEGKSSAGAVVAGLRRGKDEKEFAKNREFTGFEDELTFECYKIYTNSGILVKIILNGREIISSLTTGVEFGKTINVWNELGTDAVIRSMAEYTIEESEIFDYSAISADNTQAREITVGKGYNLGRDIGVNQGAKIKMTLTEANLEPIPNDSPAIKFGVFKALATDIWGANNSDGYIVKFNLSKLTVSLISSHESTTFVDDVSFADKLTNGYEVVMEYSASKITLGEEEIGHVLVVKINGYEVIKYANTGNSVKLSNYFNVYNNTKASVMVDSTISGFDLQTNVTGNGDVLGTRKLEEGSSAKVRFLPAEGYRLTSVVYNGSDVTADVVDGCYTIESVSESDVLDVTFALIEYTYANADVKDLYDYTQIQKQTVLSKGYSDALRLGKSKNYGVRFSINFPVPTGEITDSGKIFLGIFKVNDGWVWGEGGFIITINPLQQTIAVGGDTQDIKIIGGTFQHDWTAGGKVDFEISVCDYYLDGEVQGQCLIIRVNGEESVRYRFNDRPVGDHFCLYNELAGDASFELSTSYESQPLNYEIVGEGLGTVECSGILNGNAVVKIIPNAEVKVESVILNDVDFTSKLVGDGTGYKLNLELIDSTDKLVVTFVSMKITYESAEVKDFYDLSGGIITVDLKPGATPLMNLSTNENVGIKFALEPNANKGEIKIGLFKGNANDVWDIKGYILALDASNRKVSLIIMTASGDKTVETIVAQFDIPAELGELKSVPVEVSLVNGVQNGVVVAHRISVTSMGMEILSYTAQSDALALGTYINVYNNTNANVRITTAEQMIELSVEVIGEGSVTDARAIAGRDSLIRLNMADGYYPKTATVNGEETSIIKNGKDYYALIPNASASDVIVVTFDVLTYEAPVVYDLFDIIGAPSFVLDKPAVNAGLGYVQGNGSEAVVLNITLPENFSTKLKFGFFKDKAAPHIWNGVGIIVEITLNGKIYLRDSEENILGEITLEEAKAGKTFRLEIGVVRGFADEEYVANYYYVKFNGEIILGYNDYSCTPYGAKLMHPYLDSAQTITFTSTYTFYNVTSSETEGIAAKVDRVVKAGEDIQINVGVLEGYVITSMSANGVDVTDKLRREGMAYVLELEELKEDIELVIVTERKQVVVTVEEIENADVALSANNVDFGGSTTLTITLDAGYEVESITVNGVAVTEGIQVEGNVVTYVLKAVTEDSTIEVTLISRTYTITVNEFEGGEATLSATEVAANGSVTLTLKLDAGYQLVQITVNGQKVSIGTDGTLVVSGINENKQIMVEVEKSDDESVGSSESKESSSKKGCGSAVSGSGVALMGVLFVALAIIKRRREN